LPSSRRPQPAEIVSPVAVAHRPGGLANTRPRPLSHTTRCRTSPSSLAVLSGSSTGYPGRGAAVASAIARDAADASRSRSVTPSGALAARAGAVAPRASRRPPPVAWIIPIPRTPCRGSYPPPASCSENSGTKPSGPGLLDGPELVSTTSEDLPPTRNWRSSHTARTGHGLTSETGGAEQLDDRRRVSATRATSWPPSRGTGGRTRSLAWLRMAGFLLADRDRVEAGSRSPRRQSVAVP
jgi:hypothetical protein